MKLSSLLPLDGRLQAQWEGPLNPTWRCGCRKSAWLAGNLSAYGVRGGGLLVYICLRRSLNSTETLKMRETCNTCVIRLCINEGKLVILVLYVSA